MARRKRGVITDVRGSGGYQAADDHDGMHLTLGIQREGVRCMFPGEFLSILERHRHPRWPSIGVFCVERVNEARAAAGIEKCGTVWVANCLERRDLVVIPANCIPYTSIKSAEWDERQNRWKGGGLAQGWRPALETLVTKTYLEPSSELSWLIGKDSFTLAPHEYRR